MDRTPARPMHNLFFALWPDEALRARIETEALALHAAHPARGRRIKPARYHLTLCYLGAHAEITADLVADARAAGERVRIEPFACMLDVAGSFANRSIPWWIGCSNVPAAMIELVEALGEGMRSRGHPPKNETSFAAHMTVLRDAERKLPPTAIEPVAWHVDEFVLVDSELGSRPSYTILGRWSLTPPR